MKIHEMYDFTGKILLVRGFFKNQNIQNKSQKQNFQETFAQTL